MGRRRWWRVLALVLALGLYPFPLSLTPDRLGSASVLVAWIHVWAGAILVLATLGLVGAGRCWRAYLPAGAAVMAWGWVSGVLPEPPGWWVLWLAAFLLGTLGIIVGSAVLLVRSGCPVRFPQLCALALWLVVPFWVLAASQSLLSTRLTEVSAAVAVGDAWLFSLVFLPPVLLVVWVAAALSLRLRRRSGLLPQVKMSSKEWFVASPEMSS